METVFPVFFFDGKCQSNIGNVVVYPSLDYKTFQSILAHKIGISPNQFSVYIADGKTSRKIPISGKANFAAISRDKDRYFIVALRRSRDSRSRRRRRPPEKPVAMVNADTNVLLLKRNMNNNSWQGVNGSVLACVECVKAKETGRDVGFHWCVYDAVTFGFRSPAGPIARPVKGSYK